MVVFFGTDRDRDHEKRCVETLRALNNAHILGAERSCVNMYQFSARSTHDPALYPSLDSTEDAADVASAPRARSFFFWNSDDLYGLRNPKGLVLGRLVGES